MFSLGETEMKASTFIGIPLLLALVAGAALAADERVDKLPEVYRKWLEEEVVYIIAKREKDVFLELTTTQERDRFIETFWERRDPDPVTLENEFQSRTLSAPGLREYGPCPRRPARRLEDGSRRVLHPPGQAVGDPEIRRGEERRGDRALDLYGGCEARATPPIQLDVLQGERYR